MYNLFGKICSSLFNLLGCVNIEITEIYGALINLLAYDLFSSIHNILDNCPIASGVVVEKLCGLIAKV